MKDLKTILIANYTTLTQKQYTLELTYQCFGQPLGNATVVLVVHALTGNSQVMGENGWWNDIVGPNKCIDTKHYTVLCFDIPGNGYGANKGCLIEHYKDFTSRDVSNVFALGLKKLNISSLYAVVGASLGGGIAWHLAIDNPELCQHIIPIASHWRATDWLVANAHIQDSILNNSETPIEDARKHAMTFYRTAASFDEKFGNKKQDTDAFAVEYWLDYHGNTLKNRFRLSAYKLMNHLLKTIRVAETEPDFLKKAARIKGDIRIVTIETDGLFHATYNWQTYFQLKKTKPNTFISEIKSIHGHDAFLIEFSQLAQFLKPVFQQKHADNEKSSYHPIRNW